MNIGVAAKAEPAKLVPALEAYILVSDVSTRNQLLSKKGLTSHVVASIILLNVITATRTRTLLRNPTDSFQACFFMLFMISLFVARCTIVVLVAGLSFVPWNVMLHASLLLA